MPKKIDLTGQRFGKLSVIREGQGKYTQGGNRKVTWVCVCDCNPDKEFEVCACDLKNGHTKSCGCWNKEKAKLSKFKQKNTYDLSGEYGIGYTQKGEEFWFDLEDYDLIKNYNWRIHHKYVEAHVPMSNPRKQICMHRLVMGLADVKYDYTIDVDHIRTEHKFDNRKKNLRIVTKAENTRNHIIQKNNTSGINGVYYSDYHKCWRVRIRINNKEKQFDCKSKEEAIQLRKELEDKYYGEFTYDNSQKYADSLGI